MQVEKKFRKYSTTRQNPEKARGIVENVSWRIILKTRVVINSLLTISLTLTSEFRYSSKKMAAEKRNIVIEIGD